MIIWNELKKILTLRTFMLVGMITFIFYHLFIMFEFNYFPNGRPTVDSFNISKEMIHDYGQYMDKDEFEDFKDVYEKEVEKADSYLKNEPVLVQAGIDSYDSFRNAVNDVERDPAVEEVHTSIMFEKEVDVFWELQARESLIGFYERRDNYGPNDQEISPGQLDNVKKRVDEILSTNQHTSLMSYIVFENYLFLIEDVAIVIFLTIMIVITPLYLTDRKNGLELLQYTSKAGRKVFTHKLVAGVIATTLFITLQLSLFFSLYRGNGTSIFFPLNINSIFNHFPTPSWLDLTFFQFIVLTVIGIYILGYAVLLIVSFLSSVMPNYLSIIGSQIPLMFLLVVFGVPMAVTQITNIFSMEYLWITVWTASLTAGVLIMGSKMRRERVRDVA